MFRNYQNGGQDVWQRVSSPAVTLAGMVPLEYRNEGIGFLPPTSLLSGSSEAPEAAITSSVGGTPGMGIRFFSGHWPYCPQASFFFCKAHTTS